MKAGCVVCFIREAAFDCAVYICVNANKADTTDIADSKQAPDIVGGISGIRIVHILTSTTRSHLLRRQRKSHSLMFKVFLVRAVAKRLVLGQSAAA